MKKWAACVGSLLLAVLLAGCGDTPPDVDPATPSPGPEKATKALVLGQYRLKIPEDWTEVSPAAGGENLRQFQFTDSGKSGDCILGVVQPASADSPGIAASYLHLMSRFLDMDEVTQVTAGEQKFSAAEFQMNGLSVSVVAFQQGEDLLLISVQGLDDVSRQQEIAKALAATFEGGL